MELTAVAVIASQRRVDVALCSRRNLSPAGVRYRQINNLAEKGKYESRAAGFGKYRLDPGPENDFPRIADQCPRSGKSSIARKMVLLRCE